MLISHSSHFPPDFLTSFFSFPYFISSIAYFFLILLSIFTSLYLSLTSASFSFSCLFLKTTSGAQSATRRWLSYLPDDGSSKDLWNACQYLKDYTAQRPRRQSLLYSAPWEREILSICDALCSVEIFSFHKNCSNSSVAQCHVRKVYKGGTDNECAVCQCLADKGWVWMLVFWVVSLVDLHVYEHRSFG
jgi:hypothetical protein